MTQMTHRMNRDHTCRRAAVVLLASVAVLLPGTMFAGKKTVTGTVDESKTHQQIAGFGGSEAFYQGWLSRNPNSDEIYDALFGPVNGLHIDFLRLQDSYRYQDVSTDPARPTTRIWDADTLAIVNGANALRANPMTIVMSSWSPPASLKSNHSEKNGGTLIKVDGKYDYAGFAKYWKDSVAAYRKLGIDPTYISLQNELDFTAEYESCRFNPTEAPFHGDSFAGYDKAVTAVYAAVHQLPNPPYIIGPETFGIGYGNVQDYLNTMPMDKVGAIAHHLYTGGDKKNPDTYIPAMQAVKDATPGKVRFMTEYYDSTGFETVLMIHDSMVTEDLSMYLYWPLAWPGDTGTILTVENPDEPAKWKHPHGWAYAEGYFALKQFSYFIHAGYKRVDATTSNDEIKLSAYLSPNKDKLVVVAINTSDKNTTQVKLKLGSFEHGQSVVYRTTFPVMTEKFAKQPALGADGMLSLPPQSVATVEVSH